MVAVQTGGKDENGDEIQLSFYNSVNCDIHDRDTLNREFPNGLKIAIKEPFCKGHFIRIDEPRNVIKFKEITYKDIDSIKQTGNKLFKDKEYILAIKEYEKAMNVVGDDIDMRNTLLSNTSLCYFELRMISKSNECALKIMENNSNHAKAIYRHIYCLIYLNELSEAEKCLKNYQDKIDGEKNYNILKHTLDKFSLNIKGIYEYSNNAKDYEFVQNFAGDIEIRLSYNRGRGLFASKDIPKNTLIMSERSFEQYYYDKNSRSFEMGNSKLISKIIQKISLSKYDNWKLSFLKGGSNDQLIPDLYKLLSYKNEEIDDCEALNTYQIEDIIKYNAFEFNYDNYDKEKTIKGAAIFACLSFLNHSQNSNTHRYTRGPMAFLITKQLIKKDSEIYTEYISDKDYRKLKNWDIS